MVEMFSTNPARIFNLQGRGTLRPGAIADVTVIDPNLEWTYNVENTRSKSKNTPFDGWKFQGGVIATIVGGKVVYHRE
jgi:dihydroorotase